MHSLRNTSAWYLCTDGQIIQPLDLFFLVFPNYGRHAWDEYACVAQKIIGIPLLDSVLPGRTEWFTPDHLVDSTVIMLVLSLLVAMGITATKIIWDQIGSNFRAITPEHKKWYVVANLFKAFLLGCIALSSRCWMGAYLSFFHDQFLGIELKRLSMLYASTDVVALFMVPKLPLSTIIHHVTSSLMCIAVSAMDLQAKGWDGILGVAKMGVLYGTFSSLPFLVNAYLGLRVVYPIGTKWVAGLCQLSLLSYVLCCSLNWGMHAVWLVNYSSLSIINVVYCLLVVLIAYDDVILMRWLVKRSTPVAEKKLD